MNQEYFTELDKIIRGDYNNVAGIIVQKNGVTWYESYYHGYTANSAFHVFSVTKSIISVTCPQKPTR